MRETFSLYICMCVCVLHMHSCKVQIHCSTRQTTNSENTTLGYVYVYIRRINSVVIPINVHFSCHLLLCNTLLRKKSKDRIKVQKCCAAFEIAFIEMKHYFIFSSTYIVYLSSKRKNYCIVNSKKYSYLVYSCRTNFDYISNCVLKINLENFSFI